MNRGVLASVVASALFAAIFLVSGSLKDIGHAEVYGWRIVLTLLVISPVYALVPARRAQMATVLGRIRARPSLLFFGAIASALVGVQLWLFMYAPMNGYALATSLGYFLLPLVMVVVGRAAFSERLSQAQKIAVTLAIVGVGHQVVFDGGLAWPTLVICLGYPLYFAARRRARFESNAAFTLEILLLTPLALYFILTSVHGPGAELLPVLSIGLLGAVAMFLYLGAASLLSLSVFGLLSYVEPVLLMVAAVIMGEQLLLQDAFTYVPILLALVLLAADGFRAARSLR
ncbi:EamA family transporter RarD [Paeniglutamicibacter gangotriensis]|uniref:Chloramphenicol-sensitive RarD protein n=2 Tax=Paeniglutamicibacter gangotriensis TaxID=254787 RepID=M7NHC3_9MICC|nr:EamA family transporter RarD [Paeniglutamicibacter gangotriensis]EMQ97918.1 chloramphenicol-sensitive RarD protein [Paeniglutamicibacter gangotriensis Lz1y]KAA0978908.1 EamA family transporter RarD [Paeniglutamicibacter gangotriensis]